jgi:hypothetical protein
VDGLGEIRYAWEDAAGITHTPPRVHFGGTCYLANSTADGGAETQGSNGKSGMVVG